MSTSPYMLKLNHKVTTSAQAVMDAYYYSHVIHSSHIGVTQALLRLTIEDCGEGDLGENPQTACLQ
jgi:hypothetical protein